MSKHGKNMKDDEPLVSIMIPNRNHSMYLEQSIEGALNQTYLNIEVIVLDNCSTDDSIEVAKRYLDRGVRVCKNPINIAIKTIDVLVTLATGKYIMLHPADDLIKPTLIEKCVNIMEKHHNVGYVHCDRDLIDENGVVTELDPFYMCSFISPGSSALPIYMVAEVAQAAQCLMRRSAFNSAGGFMTEFDHLNVDKDLWFRLSLVSDYAYIRDKLSLIRIHQSRETVKAFRNFYHPLALYLTLNHHIRLGHEQHGHENVIAKIPAAYAKLASELVRIAIFSLNERNLDLARKYLMFAQIVNPEISQDSKYQEYWTICSDPEKNKNTKTPIIMDDMFITRKRNYEPPANYTQIDLADYEN